MEKLKKKSDINIIYSTNYGVMMIIIKVKYWDIIKIGSSEKEKACNGMQGGKFVANTFYTVYD